MLIKRFCHNSLFIFLACLVVLEARALSFKDQSLDTGKVLNPIKLVDVLDETEIHADGTITNQFFSGIAGFDEVHRALIDYRVELHTPLYNLNGHKGKAVTRLEGIAPADNNIDGFFDDRLIEIPELFIEDSYKYENNTANLVFGRFANRRFFNKNEITPDSFDIGERSFFGTTENTSNLLNSINEFRDPDVLGSRIATGSFGFVFELKNNTLSPDSPSMLVSNAAKYNDTVWQKSKKFLVNNWGFKQGFAVAQLSNFGDNYYGISEINKNWGIKKPGQLNLGFLYGDGDAFRLIGDNKSAYLLYASLAQKIDRWSGYVRWGSLFNTVAGIENVINEFNIGAYCELTAKNLIATHFLFTDLDKRLSTNNNAVWINTWKHSFTDNVASWVFTAFQFNVINPGATNGTDNSWSTGFNVQFVI